MMWSTYSEAQMCLKFNNLDEERSGVMTKEELELRD